MNYKERYYLERIFGKSVRIKILEILLDEYLKKERDWSNISYLAKTAKISTSSSKRVVDQLIKEGVIELNLIETHAKNPEKNVRVNLDNKAISELLFFYQKLKGFL